MEHIPVLLNEVVELLNPKKNQNFVDATVGGGGHSSAILECTSPQGLLLGFDKDESALNYARVRLEIFGKRVKLINSSYTGLAKALGESKLKSVSGILFDLGFNSWQLHEADRGFSWQQSGVLDLRYNKTVGEPAYEWLNTRSAEELAKIFKDFGEEPYAHKIAQAIILERQTKLFYTTHDLLTVVSRVKGGSSRSLPPATLIWQALRIAVNNELSDLVETLPQALTALEAGGRLAVISFHSGEDKIVKDFFKREARGCLCPPEFPKCICGHVASLKIITPKPITPTPEELTSNPRSRSAKLRVAEKI